MTGIYRLHKLTLTAPGEPLFAALADAVPGMSRGQARDAVMAGLVQVGGVVVTTPKHLLGDGAHAVLADLRQGTKRSAAPHGPGAQSAVAARPFTVLYEDADVVVVDKAVGVLSAPLGPSDRDPAARNHVPELLRRMWRKRGQAVRFIGVVHRLDKETSGCLAFALSRAAETNLAAQFACHSAGRTYRCLTDGAPSADQMTLTGVIARGPDGRRCFRFDETARDRLAEREHIPMDDDAEDSDFDGSASSDRQRGYVPRGGSQSQSASQAPRRDGPGRDVVTHLSVLRRMRRGAELEVTLETGRTHQIRVSLLAIGCPVSGDPVYFDRSARAVRPVRAPRMMLHAATLAFDHPVTGRAIEVTAPLPAEFAAHAQLLDDVGGHSPRR